MIGNDKNRELALMLLWHGGELIVQERTHKPEGGLGFWGGKIKVGEEPQTAAIRETGEEITIEDFRPESVSALGEEIEADGWLIHAFQASLSYGTKFKAKEGKAERIYPRDMWIDPRLMEASRAVIKEFILIPNGFIDN